MADNKNQHYVPKLLLRRFANPDGKTVRKLVMGRSKVVPTAAVAHECSGDYFYGKDSEADRKLREVETAMGAYVRGELVVPEIFQCDSTLRLMINDFVSVQLHRTRRSVENQRKRQTRMFESIVGSGGAKKLSEHPEIRKLVGPELSQILVEQGLCNPHLIGLRICIVRAAGVDRFVIADDPVVKFNQAYPAHLLGLKKSSAPEHRGVQIMLPVSPTHALFYYDSTVYEVASGQVAVLSASDVEIANGLQIANADTSVYAGPETSADHLLGLAEKFKGYRRDVVDVRAQKVALPSGEQATMVSDRILDLTNPISWGFCKVKEGPIPPFGKRDEDLSIEAFHYQGLHLAHRFGRPNLPDVAAAKAKLLAMAIARAKAIVA